MITKQFEIKDSVSIVDEEFGGQTGKQFIIKINDEVLDNLHEAGFRSDKQIESYLRKSYRKFFNIKLK